MTANIEHDAVATAVVECELGDCYREAVRHGYTGGFFAWDPTALDVESIECVLVERGISPESVPDEAWLDARRAVEFAA